MMRQFIIAVAMLSAVLSKPWLRTRMARAGTITIRVTTEVPLVLSLAPGFLFSQSATASIGL